MIERAPPAIRGLLALAVGLTIALAGGAYAQAATVEAQLASLTTIQPFNGEATSISQFGSRWRKFEFAVNKGRDTATGWASENGFLEINAAYYTTSSYTAASGGAAAAVTMAVSPEASSRTVSLWLDATNEAGARKSGYELRFTVEEEEESLYAVRLLKWVAGTETVLRSAAEVRFNAGNSFAIVDQGGTVSAYTDTGAGFRPLLTASDTTFDRGNVGLSTTGRESRLRAYKAGQLAPATPTLTSTNPASPSDNIAPFVIGTATRETTVKLYTNATCSGEPVATGTAAALASPGLQVTVAESTTTRIYATATDPTSKVSDCSSAISYTHDPTIGIATALAGLTTLDAFGTAQNPLSSGGRWSRLGWAANTGQVVGSGTTGGWTAANGYPVVSGAYWNPATFADAGRGVAAAGTLSVGAELPSRWFSVWVDMSEPGSAQSGYELRFTYAAEEEGENLYNVTLSKWVAGTRTVLASRNGYTFAPQSSFALVDKGGTVYAWIDSGSGYRQLLSGRDSTFSRGSVGIEGAGNASRVRSFRAGAL
jgi:hypothetical protein